MLKEGDEDPDAPAARLQIADIIVQEAVSAKGKRDIDLWTG